MARGILLTGGVGSGKTTVLLALGELLEERDEPYALVDLDWLAWLRPAPETLSVGAVLAANLAAAWKTFRQAGVEQIVLARALQSAGELEMIRGALPGVDVVAVRLTVSPSLQEQRLRVRDTGRELAEHLALLAGGEAPVFEDTTVANDDLPSAVAAEVLAAAGWAPL